MIKVFWPEKPCRLRQASPRWARVSGVAARCMIWANMHSTSRRNSSFRWLIAAMVGAFAFVSYVQRMNVSVAPELMMPDFGLTKSQMGQIFSSFWWDTRCFKYPPAGWVTRSARGSPYPWRRWCGDARPCSLEWCQKCSESVRPPFSYLWGCFDFCWVRPRRQLSGWAAGRYANGRRRGNGPLATHS